MWVAFALQKLLTFFSKKFQHICISLNVNFNKSLTNDVVSFEQLGPGFLFHVQIVCKGIIVPEQKWMDRRAEMDSYEMVKSD